MRCQRKCEVLSSNDRKHGSSSGSNREKWKLDLRELMPSSVMLNLMYASQTDVTRWMSAADKWD